MCNSPENINPENRDRLIKFLSNQMDRLLGYRREYREGKIHIKRTKIFTEWKVVHLACNYNWKIYGLLSFIQS